MDTSLVSKYNVVVPRYTSYPTVPYWQDTIDVDGWKAIFRKNFKKDNDTGVSLYIHLPFCASLCTYCGCNKKITSDHSVEHVYIEALLKEWALYRSLMDEKPKLRELHLGGGTPTFFSPENLKYLLNALLEDCELHEQYEFSFEGHPNNTTIEHLQALYDVGFRRVSYGVQDNNPEVQRIINRIQPLENVKDATDNARNIGYSSVNYDLIYGLPLQTVESVSETVMQTIALRPDRIAFYSYAHVPWTVRGQRLFDESDLPAVEDKLAMYQAAKELFLANGYHDIGMDHFALSNDELYIAHHEGRLHRNFMGYTTQRTNILIGLGVSAISSTADAHTQNAKALHTYYECINNDMLATQKGYFLTQEDKRFGNYIMDISCNGKAEIRQDDMATVRTYSHSLISGLLNDGLITMDDNSITVTEEGRNFIRNICSVFDLHLRKSRIDKEKQIFSKAV